MFLLHQIRCLVSTGFQYYSGISLHRPHVYSDVCIYRNEVYSVIRLHRPPVYFGVFSLFSVQIMQTTSLSRGTFYRNQVFFSVQITQTTLLFSVQLRQFQCTLFILCFTKKEKKNLTKIGIQHISIN